MKISKIAVKNFLGLRDFNIDVTAPIVLVCGPNGSGKSSLRDALRFALVSEQSRDITTKKDAVNFICTGEKESRIEISTDDGESLLVIKKSGEIVDARSKKSSEPLKYVLDSDRFARLSNTERKQFLFDLMGINIATYAIKQKMLDRGCDPDLTESILPMLRAGFPSAQQEAESRRRDEKRAWKQITSEEYGSDKAAHWKAVPAVKMEKGATREEIIETINKLTDKIDNLQRQIGSVRNTENQRHILQADITQAKSKTIRIPELTTNVEAFKQALKNLNDKLSTAKLNNQFYFTCPDCGVSHRAVINNNRLIILQPSETENSNESKESLEGLTNRKRVIENDLNRFSSELSEATNSQNRIAILEEQLKSLGAVQYVSNLEKQVYDTKTYSLVPMEQRLKDIDTAERADAEAVKRTQSANEIFQVIQKLDKIVAALSPDGIPGEILKEAIGPLNSRLSESARASQWPLVEISEEMDIKSGGREYRLLSESEKWRVDAMITEAISKISGEGLIVLDRMDVLDLPGRSKALAWLNSLAREGQGTFIVAATLKEPPKLPSDNFQVVWMPATAYEAESS